MLQQSRLDFEWVIINDGKDEATRHLIQSTPFPFSHQYLEIDHPVEDFGLCIARNLGIEIASSNYVCYLDDDNSFRPTFIATVLNWIEQYPHSRFILPQQWRRRDVIKNGQIIKQGKPFISPSADATLNDLVSQKALFDSNGFVHRQINSLCWNPHYRVFSDYEFFLQCLSQCNPTQGEDFLIKPEVLINYIQTTDGIIGQSGYGDWANELQQLYENRLAYSMLGEEWANWMPQAIEKYQQKSQVPVPAFKG